MKNKDNIHYLDSNGFVCGFNTPPALESKGSEDEEVAQGLPPYDPVNGHLVDMYPACPDNWMRSEGKLTSYFVPVGEDRGLWLDFNPNDKKPYHVAMVISVQGINPITGLPCSDPQLEQYIEKCPKHNTNFGPNRYCEKCGFKWPKQNYICTTGTPYGQLWLDGFRSADGIVRQYILTAEKMRGVASNIIGNDRVFAVGISFFFSKDKKPEPTRTVYRRGSWDTTLYKSSGYYSCKTFTGDVVKGTTTNSSGKIDALYSSTSVPMNNMDLSFDNDGSAPILCSAVGAAAEEEVAAIQDPSRHLEIKDVQDHITANKLSTPKQKVKTKKLEVGAGAKIRQQVYDDPNKLDFWRDEPEAILCINYCTLIDAEKIIKQGSVDLEGSKEGFLQNVPVGN